MFSARTRDHGCRPYLGGAIIAIGLLGLAGCTSSSLAGSRPEQDPVAASPAATDMAPTGQTPGAPAAPTAVVAQPASGAAPSPVDQTTPPTLAQVYASFAPSPGHSAVVVDPVAWTPDRIHTFLGSEDLPPLEPLSPVLASTGRLTVLPAAIRVRTAPNAQVAAWADQLGSFCTGARGIVVTADAAGLAVIDVKTGVSAGDYPIYLASPARSGILVITVGAK